MFFSGICHFFRQLNLGGEKKKKSGARSYRREIDPVGSDSVLLSLRPSLVSLWNKVTRLEKREGGVGTGMKWIKIVRTKYWYTPRRDKVEERRKNLKTFERLSYHKELIIFKVKFLVFFLNFNIRILIRIIFFLFPSFLIILWNFNLIKIRKEWITSSVFIFPLN